MERDLFIMSAFLVMAQEVINKFKQGIKLTMREKVICLAITARTFESWERITNAQRDTQLLLN